MERKIYNNLTPQEKKEYCTKLDKISNLLFDLEDSLDHGENARHAMYLIRCDIASIQSNYFKDWC